MTGLWLRLWWATRSRAIRRLRREWPAEAESWRRSRRDGWEDSFLREAYVYLVKKGGPA